MDHSRATDTSAPRTATGIAIRLNVGNRPISNGPRRANTPMETHIKIALERLLAGIKAADGQTVADEMAKLDEYLERGRAGLHPQLVHFLQNRSYAKALMFLGGDTNIPVGVCGGRAGKKV